MVEEFTAAEIAEFRALKAAEVARKHKRMASQWVAWAAEVGGDPQAILRAYDMARALITEHAPGWELKFTGARERDGAIHYWHKKDTKEWDGVPGTLTLSGPLMSLSTEAQQRECHPA